MAPKNESCCDAECGFPTPLDAMKNGPREKLVYVPCIQPSNDKPDYLATIDVDPKSDTYSKSCCEAECGFPTPLDAMKNGPREKLVYVPCIQPSNDKPDYLATIDVDPKSDTYSKVIHRLPMKYAGDEVHHTGWNACSSCYGVAGAARNKLIMPCLLSDRVYIVDTGTDPRTPTIHKIVEPEEFVGKTGRRTPHTSHCLSSGEIMISTMGDENGNGKGSFVLLDGNTFEVK
ncbi:unnamed protein product, partial [Notodromas monacha]